MNTARSWLITKLGGTPEPARTDTAEPTPLWVVIVLAVFLLPLAADAFTLSFQMLLPVMILAGWSTNVAWLGPVLIDIAAGAGAFMLLAVRHRSVRTSGMLLLVASTGLSIAGNLAGHSIARPGPAQDLPPELVGASLPQAWGWVVELLSIAAPLFVAGLVHAFGHVLVSYVEGVRRPAQAARRAKQSQPTNPQQSRSARTPAAPRETSPAAPLTSPAAGEPAASTAHPSTPAVEAATPKSNVREIHPGQPTLKEKGKAWFFAQVEAGRAPNSITAVEIDREIGAKDGYCKKLINLWRDELAAQAVVNQ